MTHARRLAPDGFSIGATAAKTAHVCSMGISQDVRRYAQENGLDTDEAIAAGMEQKSAEFLELGGSVYGR